VQVANGAGLSITHIGHSQITGSSRPLLLKNILRVPAMSKNLLSMHKLLLDNHAYAEVYPHHFYVKDQATRALLLRGRCQGGLYPVPSNPVTSTSSSSRHCLTSSTLSTDHWHRRLGHPSLRVLESVLRKNKVACALPSTSLVCDSCQRAKVHQLPYSRSSHCTNSPLELVHSDVWGPAISSVGGFRYYVSFVDDFSRYTWIYLIKRKSDVEKSFYHFQTHVERLLQTKIRMVQSDGGGEYTRLSKYFDHTGIYHRVTCPHTSQQNGIAERKHRHIVETGIALLAHSSLPVRFWDEAFLTAVYLINRMPAQNLQNTAPLTCLRGEHPDYSFLRAFGCACWPNLRPYNNRKLAFRSRLCVFLGYSQQHKGYKCLDRSSGRIFVSRDVVFEENFFPYANPSPASNSPPPPPINVPTIFASSEPVIQDDRMRNYDLTLLATNTPATSSSSNAGFHGGDPSDSGASSPRTPAPSSASPADSCAAADFSTDGSPR
jgi:histone deacetylase 1/2